MIKWKISKNIEELDRWMDIKKNLDYWADLYELLQFYNKDKYSGFVGNLKERSLNEREEVENIQN